jgi:hypothetical protein
LLGQSHDRLQEHQDRGKYSRRNGGIKCQQK